VSRTVIPNVTRSQPGAEAARRRHPQGRPAHRVTTCRGRFSQSPVRLYPYRTGDHRATGAERPIWVVLCTTQCIETVGADIQNALITELADSDARLVAHGAGIWGFRWSPSRGVHVLSTPNEGSPVPGRTIAGPAGRAELSGPVSQEAAVSTGRRGHVIEGDDFLRGPDSDQLSPYSDTGMVRHRQYPSRQFQPSLIPRIDSRVAPGRRP
jgi:hypothetical protein